MNIFFLIIFLTYNIYNLMHNHHLCQCEELDTADVIKEHGYTVEEYTVQTEDRYLLKVYRIPEGINKTIKNNTKSVLLNHGLFANSGCFILLNPNRTLGYILADHGYDVWLLNVRGTATSNKHISLDPHENPKEFYNFSWHEIGYYDLPATIDFILEKTNKNQIQYIGHSQGATTFLVMASMRPEYNSKISLASLLAPAAYFYHIGPVMGLITSYWRQFSFHLNMFNIYAVQNDYVRNTLRSMCQYRDNYPTCFLIVNLVSGYHDPVQINPNIVFRTIFRLLPSTVSFKQVYHYFQIINSKKFRQYDYGTENMNIYGSSSPPEYNLSSITAPVALYAGLNDIFANNNDVQSLGSVLKNVLLLKIVKFQYFNHVDFLFATDVVELLYNDVLKYMDSY